LQIDTAILVEDNYDVNAHNHDPNSKDLFIGSENYITGNESNVIYSGDGDDFLFGNGGSDQLEGGTGNDYIDGGIGIDTALYISGSPINLNVRATSANATYPNTIELDAGSGDVDHIRNIERVELTDINDVITITRNPNIPYPNNVMFDAASGIDTLQYAGEKVVTSIRELSAASEQASSGISMDLIGNIEKIKGTAGDDKLNIGLLTSTKVETIEAGAGEDTVWVFGSAIGAKPVIDLGANDDILKHAPQGAIVYGGTGNDTFNIGKDFLIADAEEDDVITNGTQVLHGGVTWRGQESPWAKGLGGIKYAQNDVGELVIEDRAGNQTFVANFNFSLSGPRTAGILIGEMSLDAYRLFNTPNGAKIYESFEAIFGGYLKAMIGISFFPGVDPLVLDLDGDGIELSPRGSISPYYDIDGDGFGEKSGWLRGDDAFLVRDLNSNGTIDDVSEMFGNATTTGFASLATLDSNTDGKISSADTNFGTIKIWRDLDGDAVTDSGELQTLTAAGITEISLATTPANSVIAGNVVTATSTFTRSNSTTGTIGDVTLSANQRDTVWLGDTTIDSASEALPEVKGFGTLTDLRIAMTDSSALKTAVTNALPSLDSLDLEAMRAAVLPVMNEWRAAVTVPSGTPGTVARADVPILTETDITGTVINDYAYQVTDTNGTYWKLASGNAVKDSSNIVIDYPAFAEVMAQTSTEGTWTVLSGEQIQFVERYWGMELPIGTVEPANSGAIAAASNVINSIWDVINGVAIRLAVQGPLESYFEGIEYNLETDHFVATTDQMIVPTLENIFDAAPNDAPGAVAYLAEWKPILNVFLGGFERENNLVISHAFLFQNVVAAYENIGLAATIKQAGAALGISEDIIITGSGTMTGTSDQDLFYLGAGDQVAQGGLGPDSYIVGENFGHDVIDDVEAPLSGSPDTLRFAHLNSSEVSMVRDGLDLVITEIGESNDIRIIGQFSRQLSGFGLSGLDPDHGVQEIIFADGEVWDKIDIAKAVSTHTNGNDVIDGTDTIDFLDGGAGNDTLRGGAEGDLYYFGEGDGDDTILDNITYVGIDSPDVVKFKPGITIDDVTFTRDGNSNDLVIEINGTSDTLTIEGQFAANYTGVLGTQWFQRIEAFSFDDGTVVRWDDVFSRVIEANQTDGNDTIYGFAYTDIFDGGEGDDYLSGGEEGDLYIMGLGYGNDTIEDGRANLFSGNNDTLQFLEGVDPESVEWSRGTGEHRDDLIFTLEDDSSVTIKNQFFLLSVFGMDTDRIEFVNFVDETEWTYEYVKEHLLDITSTSGNDTIYGYLHSDDTINGGEGDDYINGLSGSDTIIGGLGNDTLVNDGQLNETGDTTYIHNLGDGVDTIIEGGFAGSDTLELIGAGLTSTNVSVTRSTDLMSATLSFAGVTDQIILDGQFGPYGAGVENIIFNDSVTWDKDDLQQKYLETISTSGNDTIYGFGSNINHAVNDVITGGQGDDYMNGWMGDDTYIHNQGDGVDTIFDDGFSGNETLELNGAALTSTNVILTRSGTNSSSITLGFAGVTDQIILDSQFGPYGQGIENIIFNDSVTWDKDDLRAAYITNSGTSENDNIYGFNDSDDVLQGGAGSDTIDGGGGSDTSSYEDSGAAVTVNLLTNTNNGGDAAGDTLVSIENIIGSAFADTLTGNTGNNIISGLAGADTINGGDGNDTLDGGAGADAMDGGDGIDTVSYATSSAVVNVNLDITTSQDWGASGDTIVNVEKLIGSIYGDTLSAATAGSTIHGGDGDDNINGNDGNDTLYGDAGADTFYAGDGDDTIYGGLGDDTIFSQGGDNLIIGGAGADLFNGFSGTATATYVDSAAAVNIDLLTNTNTGGDAEGDMIYGVQNIIGSNFDDIILGNTFSNKLYGGGGNDLLAGIGYGGNHMDGGDGIDIVSYADSYSVVNVNLNITTSQDWGASGDTIENVENLIGSAYSDILAAKSTGSIIHGGDGYDTIDGAAGNDTLYGDEGNDSIYAGDGDDTVYGNEGDDTLYGQGGNNILIGGAGEDTLNGFTGVSTASYDGSASAVTVNLDTNVNTGGDAEGDLLYGINNIIGSSNNDSLYGNAIENIIRGGLGNDTITGGDGADVFKYSTVTDSGAASGLRDIITDFVIGTDKIDISDFAGDFTFNITDEFTGTAKEVNYAHVSGNTIIGIDSDGNGVLDLQIELAGLHSLAASDFLL
jgi:Ca2+-binding RTX toxin-like protein